MDNNTKEDRFRATIVGKNLRHKVAGMNKVRLDEAEFFSDCIRIAELLEPHLMDLVYEEAAERADLNIPEPPPLESSVECVAFIKDNLHNNQALLRTFTRLREIVDAQEFHFKESGIDL